MASTYAAGALDDRACCCNKAVPPLLPPSLAAAPSNTAGVFAATPGSPDDQAPCLGADQPALPRPLPVLCCARPRRGRQLGCCSALGCFPLLPCPQHASTAPSIHCPAALKALPPPSRP